MSAHWLDELRLSRGDWNLEIISPYFDGGHAGTLERLIETLEPKETRVYLPRDRDGSADVSSAIRAKLADHYKMANNTLARQKEELQSLGEKLG